MHVTSSKVIAGCFGLAAFAVAIVAGLAHDNPTAQILLRAILAMAVCYFIGAIAGMICERVIVLHVEQHKSSNPAPKPSAASAPTAATAPSEDEQPIVV